ncbi:MAG: SRPBCC family protein [Thermoleophilia bacterium]
MATKRRWAAGALAAITLGEAALIRLGRTYGSTADERTTSLPGDRIVSEPKVVTDHAITIDAPPSAVWPWLVQMGWGRGGWYTARWVDRLLFPANGPSADRIIPELQDIEAGTFIPDGPPHTRCGLIVEEIEHEPALVLHSNSHLPLSWRAHATLDWSWAFVLAPLDEGHRTRFHFRSRWTTSPWWLTLAGWLAIVPADFVMSRDMLRGVKVRAERASP